jgi:signal transduction histidine kinase
VTSRQQAVDVAIVAVVAAGCAVEVWSAKHHLSTHLTGPPVALFVAYMVALAALALRRRFPLPAVAVAASALTIEWLVFGASEGFGVFLILVIAGYAAAAYEDRGRALVGLAVLAATAVVWSFRDPTQTKLSDHIGAAGWMSTVLIAWLVGSYVRHLRWRASRAELEREERAEAAVASERARIARELHDIIAHNVSVMVVQAEAADEMLDRNRPERARAPVQMIEETGRAALGEMRRMLGVLRDADARPAVTPQPGIANLELLLAKVRESGLPVELDVEGEPRPLPPGLDLSAFRIVQEALTNALKHAGPARAHVLVRFAPDALELEVYDDGPGAGGETTGGNGLVGMRERAALFGGELEAGRPKEGGFRVRARLPLRAST